MKQGGWDGDHPRLTVEVQGQSEGAVQQSPHTFTVHVMGIRKVVQASKV